MTNTDLHFEIGKYVDPQETFLEKALVYIENHSQYRGFEQLLELTKSLELEEYDLYQASHEGVLSALAAVRLSGHVLHFDIFVVDPEFREIGIGDELFEFIVNQDKYKDAKIYESKALPGDRQTKNFFETRGGKARLLIVTGDIKREE